MFILLGALALFLVLLSLTVGIAHIQVEGFTKSDKAKLDMQNITGALRLFWQKAGRLPSSREGLQPLVDAAILEATPVDPWGNPYRYTRHGDEVELLSWGSDGAAGGSGCAADLIQRSVRSSAVLPGAGN